MRNIHTYVYNIMRTLTQARMRCAYTYNVLDATHSGYYLRAPTIRCAATIQINTVQLCSDV